MLRPNVWFLLSQNVFSFFCLYLFLCNWKGNKIFPVLWLRSGLSCYYYYYRTVNLGKTGHSFLFVLRHVCVPAVKVRHVWHQHAGEERTRWAYGAWRFLLVMGSQTQPQKHSQTNKFCKFRDKEDVFEQERLLICPTDCAGKLHLKWINESIN